MPHHNRPFMRGRLYIQFNVDFPDSGFLNPDQCRVLETMFPRKPSNQLITDMDLDDCEAATEEDRKRKRNANHALAMAKLKEGNVNAASELFQRAMNVTPIMAYQLIQVLRSENIDFVVAPFEADAQLAYLSKIKIEKGGVVVVIIEDSDLIVESLTPLIRSCDLLKM
ncbi:hypothetical protein K1719_033249 [Acacia pycnantha]|nr:hypothetical protein K1719_033249 [Acacia pycnantha]